MLQKKSFFSWKESNREIIKMMKHDDKSLCIMKTYNRKITIVILVRLESDYTLKNEIEDWKIEVWSIRTKGVKTSLSSLVKFQSLVFNLVLQCIVWFRPNVNCSCYYNRQDCCSEVHSGRVPLKRAILSGLRKKRLRHYTRDHCEARRSFS